MKVFKKTFLPEELTYNGYRYVRNIEASAKFSQSPYSWDSFDRYQERGLRPILVEVLSNNLKGKTDLHGKPYEPTKWVFTITEDQIKWKVVYIFKKSARKQIIATSLTRDEASRLCKSIAPTKTKSAHMYMLK